MDYLHYIVSSALILSNSSAEILKLILTLTLIAILSSEDSVFKILQIRDQEAIFASLRCQIGKLEQHCFSYVCFTIDFAMLKSTTVAIANATRSNLTESNFEHSTLYSAFVTLATCLSIYFL